MTRSRLHRAVGGVGLSGLWTRWRGVGARAATLQMRAVLWCIYYVAVVPLAAVNNWLWSTGRSEGSGLRAVPPHEPSIEVLRRQH